MQLRQHRPPLRRPCSRGLQRETLPRGTSKLLLARGTPRRGSSRGSAQRLAAAQRDLQAAAGDGEAAQKQLEERAAEARRQLDSAAAEREELQQKHAAGIATVALLSIVFAKMMAGHLRSIECCNWTPHCCVPVAVGVLYTSNIDKRHFFCLYCSHWRPASAARGGGRGRQRRHGQIMQSALPMPRAGSAAPLRSTVLCRSSMKAPVRS